MADPAFSVIDDQDAATAIVAAASTHLDGPVNVVSPGADHRHAGRPHGASTSPCPLSVRSGGWPA